MNTWLFQSMPEEFRLVDFLSTTPDRVLWRVSRYGNRMLIGDTVYIWQGLGKAKSPVSGIFARGRIEKCPRHCHDYETSADFWTNPVNALTPMKRVLVSIDSCSTTPAISRTDFETDSVLAKCNIFTVRTGSNFPLTADQSFRVQAMYI